MVAEPFRVIAHRGASAYAPENTLAAFRRAIASGVGVIEIDLRATKDGVPVILHDETLNRTTNGSGAVANYTLEELKEGELLAPINLTELGEPAAFTAVWSNTASDGARAERIGESFRVARGVERRHSTRTRSAVQERAGMLLDRAIRANFASTLLGQ